MRLPADVGALGGAGDICAGGGGRGRSQRGGDVAGGARGGAEKDIAFTRLTTSTHGRRFRI